MECVPGHTHHAATDFLRETKAAFCCCRTEGVDRLPSLLLVLLHLLGRDHVHIHLSALDTGPVLLCQCVITVTVGNKHCWFLSCNRLLVLYWSDTLSASSMDPEVT